MNPALKEFIKKVRLLEFTELELDRWKKRKITHPKVIEISQTCERLEKEIQIAFDKAKHFEISIS